MRRKHILILVLVCLIVFTVGCRKRDSIESNKSILDGYIVVEDSIGRSVELYREPEKAIAIGPGCLRLYCYGSEVDKIVGIEQLEKDKHMGRPYILAYPELLGKTTIGSGGPNNSPDAEKIIMANPDVIFTTYNLEASTVNELQEKTGIPVIALSYGEVSVFDMDMYDSIETIGKVMNTEAKAKKAIEYMKTCQKDLNERTQNIAKEVKPRVYMGALSMRGSHGIESTQGNYSIFNTINALNVSDETGVEGSIMIDKEKLIEWNPDMIFIDYGGMNEVEKDIENNPEFYKILNAFNRGAVHYTLPYNYYSTNIDTAILNAYFMAKKIYPQQFSDVDIKNKANEIYKSLLGKDVYEEMVDDYGLLK